MDTAQDLIATALDDAESPSRTGYTVVGDTYRLRTTGMWAGHVPRHTEPVAYDTNGDEVYIISDMHLGPGRSRAGTYPGTENFFSDDAFARFLTHADRGKSSEHVVLVLNGDTFDFVRNTECPGKSPFIRFGRTVRAVLQRSTVEVRHRPDRGALRRECEAWRDELSRVGIASDVDALMTRAANGEKYGLGTTASDAIYKLMTMRQGHPVFFDALVCWLHAGNRLVLIKGNHDIELCRKSIRDYIRIILAERLAATYGGTAVDALRNSILPQVTFIDDAVRIDGDVCVEHGHRYDKFTMVFEDPTAGDPMAALRPPFGSLFNRFVINRVELSYPFVDNVRPAGNIMAMMIRLNFPLALRLLLQHVPALWHVLSRGVRYTWYMLRRPVLVTVALILPLLVAVWMSPVSLVDSVSRVRTPEDVGKLFLGQLESLGVLIASYLLSRMVAWMDLAEPSCLESAAQRRLRETDCRIIAMGHTHNPCQSRYEHGRMYFDTGTWIPVVETSSAELRQDKTYTFLHLVRGAGGILTPDNEGILQRWNDDAGRAESYATIERK